MAADILSLCGRMRLRSRFQVRCLSNLLDGRVIAHAGTFRKSIRSFKILCLCATRVSLYVLIKQKRAIILQDEASWQYIRACFQRPSSIDSASFCPPCFRGLFTRICTARHREPVRHHQPHSQGRRRHVRQGERGLTRQGPTGLTQSRALHANTMPCAGPLQHSTTKGLVQVQPAGVRCSAAQATRPVGILRGASSATLSCFRSQPLACAGQHGAPISAGLLARRIRSPRQMQFFRLTCRAARVRDGCLRLHEQGTWHGAPRDVAPWRGLHVGRCWK